MILKENKLDDLSQKVMQGMKIAMKKLVEETAAKNGNLIIGDAKGAIKSVPAKELLHLVQE